MLNYKIVMMKNIIILICLVLTVFSCEDRLDIAPDSKFTAANFYNTADDIEQVVTSAYAFLQSSGQYGESFHFLMEVPADNSKEVSLTIRGGDYGQFETFNVNTANPILERAWTDCYKAIQSCNIVIARIDGIPDMDKNTKVIRKGEMQFLRALNYFNLVRLWGGVPLVLEETVDPFEFFDVGKASVSEVYNQIISDLTNAAQNLPQNQIQQGRASKGAANTLLGKVFLTLQRYAEAETALRQVVGYTLQPTYASIFGKNFEFNDESIFEISFVAGLENEGSRLTNLFGVASVVGAGEALNQNAPTLELFDLYEANDQRRNVTIGVDGDKTYPKKYIEPVAAPDDSDINVIVLRYADVILMLAEALNEQQYVADGEAFTLLNQIRTRAGITALSSTDLPNQESFREAIALERRLELALENHRWFDLIRTGKAVEVMNNSSQETADFTVRDFHVLFPIPQSQVDANPDDITQNTGY